MRSWAAAHPRRPRNRPWAPAAHQFPSCNNSVQTVPPGPDIRLSQSLPETEEDPVCRLRTPGRAGATVPFCRRAKLRLCQSPAPAKSRTAVFSPRLPVRTACVNSRYFKQSSATGFRKGSGEGCRRAETPPVLPLDHAAMRRGLYLVIRSTRALYIIQCSSSRRPG